MWLHSHHVDTHQRLSRIHELVGNIQLNILYINDDKAAVYLTAHEFIKKLMMLAIGKELYY